MIIKKNKSVIIKEEKEKLPVKPELRILKGNNSMYVNYSSREIKKWFGPRR